MVERIEKFLHADDRRQQRAIAAYIDIDRFKDINDTLGHDAGDKLIKAVAARLKARLEPKEFLSRFGGDEFVILTAPAASRSTATIAERIAQAFALPFDINGQNICVTASVGIACAPDNGASADELMRHADIALYRAKNTGRDRAVTFTAEMAQEVEQRRSIELDLREALESNELRLNYQPLISCRTGEICGIEALLRWNHPVHGEIPPAEFIPIAESSGLLPAVGQWVLERAMSDSTRWPNIEVAVNLSPVQFRHLDIDTTLRALVAKHGIDPTRFVLEITEGVLLEASERTVSIFDKIRGMGFKIALDDFGTRYSSLAYLCNFKFDKIKIDRSFTRSISTVETSRRIVQLVVTLSRGLGIDVVAEGIETENEVAIMTHFGCTELQGFYFSKPLEADQLADFFIVFQPRPIVAQVLDATG
jgi:diguanylate cyclase (GGDEF)-like protein